MSDPRLLIEIALIAALVLINGFFAAAEIAVLAARRSRLEAMVERGNRKAAAALRLKADPDRFIATVQIGVTVVSTLASAVGGVAAVDRLKPLVAAVSPQWARLGAEPIAVGTVVFAIAYLSLVVGELVPKALAVRHAEAWAARVAPLIEACSRAMRSPVLLLTASSRLFLRLVGETDLGRQPFHTLDDLRIIAEEAQLRGVIQGGLVTRAVTFHERQVREVLTPRHRIVGLSADVGLEAALNTVRASGHSRFPVFGRGADDVLGFVYARDIYEAALCASRLDLSRIARSALVVQESMPATELLAQIRQTGTPIAIVTDEHGTLSGLVTIEDLVEVIVGEIRDEHVAPESLVTVLPDGTVEADGSVKVHELNERYGLELPESRLYVSIAGLILERLGTVPQPDETVLIGPFSLRVIGMKGARISRVRIAHCPDRIPIPAGPEVVATAHEGLRA